MIFRFLPIFFFIFTSLSSLAKGTTDNNFLDNTTENKTNLNKIKDEENPEDSKNPIIEQYVTSLNIIYQPEEKIQTLFNQKPPVDIENLLKKYLPIINKRTTENLDEEQLGYLIQDTPKQVNDILATEGYFNNQVSVDKSQEKDKDKYTINIILTKRVRVENFILFLDGPIQNDDDLGYFYRDAFLTWKLMPGDPFEQKNWASGKESILNEIKKKKYPLAKISKSEAIIDPETSSALLTVHIDSDRSIKFGDIKVIGAKRYTEKIVTGMAKFKKGDHYSYNSILDLQQDLEQDGHYNGVLVVTDLEKIDNDHVPVLVRVNELPKKNIEIELGYNSEEGPEASIGYRYYNLFNRGFIGAVSLSGNKYEQGIGFGITQPRQKRGTFFTTRIDAARKIRQNIESNTLSMGLWYVYTGINTEANLGIEYHLDSSNIKNGPDLGRAYATLLTATWKKNKIQTTLRPENGYFLSMKFGTTLGDTLSTASMQSLVLDSAFYFTPEQRKYGTLVLRSTLGYIYSNDSNNLPNSLLFKTGGSTSVRGYQYESIGIEGEKNSVLGGKALAVASLEYQIPFNEDWSVAFFHDAGDVKNKIKDLKLKHSTGLGLRWFSMAAPLSLDVAYAHDKKKIGWHLNIGAKF